MARLIGAESLSAEECVGDGWIGETPLWYYVRKEAEVRAGGEHLGPVGGRILAEVLLGLLDTDSGTYRDAEPGWQSVLLRRSRIASPLPTCSSSPASRWGNVNKAQEYPIRTRIEIQ